MDELPAEALDDPFGPPLERCKVVCIHCERHFMSSEMVYETRKGFTGWFCPSPKCDGAGYGMDIWDEKEWHGA